MKSTHNQFCGVFSFVILFEFVYSCLQVFLCSHKLDSLFLINPIFLGNLTTKAAGF